MSDAGYLEFQFPVELDNGNVSHLTIDLWYRGCIDKMTSSNNNPPMNEDDVRELTEDFAENYDAYFADDLVYDAMFDEWDVRSAEELQEYLEANDPFFIY
jgi:hypothetical protein